MKLNPAKMELISGFVDTYLRLSQTEETQFQTELKQVGLVEEEQVMEIVTSWMERGIERGIDREKSLVIRLLKRRLGEIPINLESQIQALSIEQVEALGEALLDFKTEADLINWLNL